MELPLRQPKLRFEHVGDKYFLSEADTPGASMPLHYRGRWSGWHRRRIKVACPRAALTESITTSSFIRLSGEFWDKK